MSDSGQLASTSTSSTSSTSSPKRTSGNGESPSTGRGPERSRDLPAQLAAIWRRYIWSSMGPSSSASNAGGSKGRSASVGEGEDPEADAALQRRVAAALSAEYNPKEALHTFWRSFTTVYAIRQGITLSVRAIELASRRGIKHVFSFDNMLDLKPSATTEALRLALAIGGFTGGYKLLYWLLSKVMGQGHFLIPGAAGFIAGTSLLFQEQSARRIIALYLFTRLLQCWYNELKKRGYFNFWWMGSWHADGSNIGDAVLFVLTSAQVMYAYAMRPETLPSSYYKFIRKTGPVPELILDGLRKNVRGNPLDFEAINQFALKRARGNPIKLLESAYPAIIPCEILHSHHTSCTAYNFETFYNVMRRTLPLYATLTFVPIVVLRFARLLRDPVRILTSGALGALRSTIFLATLCTSYSVVICFQRKMGPLRDFKSVYYIAGIISGLAILIEKKSRRSELALYVFPRAIDSLYMQLLDRKWMGSVKHFELFLFCASMGGLMHFYQHHAYTMAPMLRYILSWLLAPSTAQRGLAASK